jgi:hypothetical protein
MQNCILALTILAASTLHAKHHPSKIPVDDIDHRRGCQVIPGL